MLVVADAFHATDLPSGGVAAIGNFDGLHRGQRALIDQVTERAKALDVPSIVITFEPHPLAVMRPDTAPLRLTTPERKIELFEEAGVDVVLTVDFTQDFARTTAGEFIKDFLHKKLAVCEVYVGSGFVFGHEREGNLALLESTGAELGFTAGGVEVVTHQEERISSTRIRKAVFEGRTEDAREMLGRPYGIGGSIVRGDRMGQRLGWPTANVATGAELLPLDGVYATRLYIPSYPATFDSVTNIGTRPTVYENYQRVVETHILGFDGDVYGETVRVQFFRRLREERIFPTIMDLSAQIGRDVVEAREYFSTLRRLEEGE